MAARNTTPKPNADAAPEYDFDSWSAEDEAKAIEALKPDIRHIIVEGDFIGRFTNGQTVRLPLNLSVDQIDDLAAESDNPVDQLKKLLTDIAGAEAAADFTRRNLTETMAMAARFFNVFERIAKASLPE
ncbi:hypothetical protein [Microbacterium stercoris]|uniref:Uncharacterized protein n=1 Tax=Microbacterium stercoris TaxID=2820289 RepID=A0A939TQR4_9MICO|nr:hypothetical protein [Microbacterium stercoris]MBO3663735.1 hypothetical protein [Microbacterium stercoris]